MVASAISENHENNDSLSFFQSEIEKLLAQKEAESFYRALGLIFQ